MKLTIKTLTQLIFKIDIEPDKTVKDLKEAIEKEQGKDYPFGSQKLIYNGKILADENKLAEYEFDEKKFVVLMITRPPPAPKPVAPAAATSASAEQTNKGEEKTKQATRKSTNPANNTATTVSSTPSTTSSAALAASDTTQSSRTQPQQQQPSLPVSTRGSALNELSHLATGEPQSANRLASRLAGLMSQPHFRQMQDLIQQSPHLLSATIESLAASDPEMYNFISENPDVFISALNHPPLPSSRSGVPSAGQRQSSQSRAGSQQAVGVQDGGGPQPVMDQLLGDAVSEHDKEAIERLKELGFPEFLAVQAYMACDKDEQLAANLLFQMDQ